MVFRTSPIRVPQSPQPRTPSSRPDPQRHSLNPMHNRSQLKPALRERTLQSLHRPRDATHDQHAFGDTRSRHSQRLIEWELSAQHLRQRIITSRPNGPQRPISRKPSKPLSGIPQRIVRQKIRPLEPQQFAIRPNNPRHRPQAPFRPPLTRSLSSKLSRIPPNRGSAFSERQRKFQPRIRMIENDIVLRQPVELSPLTDPHGDLLTRRTPIGLVPLGRPRRSDNSMRVNAHIDVDSKLIATSNTARRMHDHRMTNRRTLRIKRSLHPQRPFMQAMLERSPSVVIDEPKFEPGAPLRMRFGLSSSERSVIFVKRHACGVQQDEERQSVPAHVRQRSTASPQDAARIARRLACAGHTAINVRTPSASILAPSPPATISPRLITQYRSAISLAKS